MGRKEFNHKPMFPHSKDDTEYYLLTKEHVHTSTFEGREILKIDYEGLRLLARQAFHDASFYLRTSHQKQVASILNDPEASENDKFVALTFLRNAEVSALGKLPFCQDTGTAIILGKKGQNVFTDCDDEEALSHGVYDTYQADNLRYSQNAPLDMYSEVNTGTNLPAQIDLMHIPGGNEYSFLMIAKGGGSANKTYFFPQTKALLNPKTLVEFLTDKIKSLGTAACPPYHIGIVIGGTTPEQNLKTVKLATARYYDNLPDKGGDEGYAFRDRELEEELREISHKIGYGAQFGGKYFSHDVRVIRLPRHGASLFVGVGVSCSADRNIKGKITKEGIFLERLETNPAQFIPEAYREGLEGKSIEVNLNRPMCEVLKELSQYPVSTRLSLNGTIIVGRDIAHAKLKELLDTTGELPEYLRNHPIYYAGPAKTPEGMPSGSFGPTTANRMDPYVPIFQEKGASMVMIAKGNRSDIVTESCKKYGGFYLGSIGGPAAILAQDSIKKVELLEYPELGMEAIWKIEVENFPAFILVDDKGNDFFKEIVTCNTKK